MPGRHRGSAGAQPSGERVPARYPGNRSRSAAGGATPGMPHTEWRAPHRAADWRPRCSLAPLLAAFAACRSAGQPVPNGARIIADRTAQFEIGRSAVQEAPATHSGDRHARDAGYIVFVEQRFESFARRTLAIARLPRIHNQLGENSAAGPASRSGLTEVIEQEGKIRRRFWWRRCRKVGAQVEYERVHRILKRA